jgi:hypothetical protein
MRRTKPREQPGEHIQYHLGPSVYKEDHYCNVCFVTVSLSDTAGSRKNSCLDRLFVHVNSGLYAHRLESVSSVI